MISILCANSNSIYKDIPGLDVWDEKRDAYFFTGSNPVITHAPCQQWSQLRFFANPIATEKELAWTCLKWVIRNGGIFEHPSGSSFFKEAGISKLYSVDQMWFGFPAKKCTYLFFKGCRPRPYPIFLTPRIPKTVEQLSSRSRSDTTLDFAQWLIGSMTDSGL